MRDCVISVRLSNEEATMLGQAAKRMGQTLSGLIRSRAVEAERIWMPPGAHLVSIEWDGQRFVPVDADIPALRVPTTYPALVTESAGDLRACAFWLVMGAVGS